MEDVEMEMEQPANHSAPATATIVEIVEQLAWFVPLLSIAAVLLLTSINVFLRVRRHFPSTVNCWFCQRNHRVPFAAANSWHCPHCTQYNGFADDGDYNQEIPAQRVRKLNSSHYARSQSSSLNSQGSNSLEAANGLCAPCNLNQELKVQQLAAFQPSHEAHFDREVDAYQAQLEQAYRLCARCERHLRRRLTRVKRTVLGAKLAQIGARGLRAFDMQLSKQRTLATTGKRRTVAGWCAWMLLVLSLLGAWRTVREAQLTGAALNRVLPAACMRLLFLGYAVGRSLWLGSAAGAAFLLGGVWQQVASVWGEWGGEGVVEMAAERLEAVQSAAAERLRAAGQSAEMSGWPPLSTERSLCLAALLLCLLRGLLIRFRHSATRSPLSLWSLRSAQPWLLAAAATHLQRLAASDEHSTADAEYYVICGRLLRVTLDAALVAASLRTILSASNASAGHLAAAAKRRRSGGRNGSLSTPHNTSNSSRNSFHRIYTEADTGEMSADEDDYDGGDASTIRSSPSSVSSATGFRRLPPQTPPNNASLNSTLSLSPSVFTPRTLRRSRDTLISSSIRSLNASFSGGGGGGGNIAGPNGAAGAAASVAASAATLGNASKFYSMMALNGGGVGGGGGGEFDVPDDFQSGITQLNISGRLPERSAGAAGLAGFTSAAHSFAPTIASSRYGSLDQLRHHHHQPRTTATSIIGPARLTAPSTIRETSPLRTSWIAGGYWGDSLSPSKRSAAGAGANVGANLNSSLGSSRCGRQLITALPMFSAATAATAATATAAPDDPLMSRTSSQSSGFESRDNGSRESSLGPAAAAAAAAAASFAAAAAADAISPSDSVSQCGGPAASSIWSEEAAASSYRPFRNPGAGGGDGGRAVYERFGTHRRRQAADEVAERMQQLRPATAMGNGSQAGAGVFQTGSLLRSWQLRNSQLDLSGRM